MVKIKIFQWFPNFLLLILGQSLALILKHPVKCLWEIGKQEKVILKFYHYTGIDNNISWNKVKRHVIFKMSGGILKKGTRQNHIFCQRTAPTIYNGIKRIRIKKVVTRRPRKRFVFLQKSFSFLIWKSGTFQSNRDIFFIFVSMELKKQFQIKYDINKLLEIYKH